MDSIVSVEHLAKRYGSTTALADVSLDVMRGEIFGIVGPNGAGETTTVELLQGLRRPDGGRVEVLGLDPQRDVAAIRQRVGTQLQAAVPPDRLKVWEALDLYATYDDDPADTQQLLLERDLVDKRDAAFDSLSGGQRKRLFIALALIGSPELVFLDELTTGLDPQARRLTWDHIRQIRARGVTVVLVTHFMDEAEALCDRIAVIDAGRVVALDTPASLTLPAIEAGATGYLLKDTPRDDLFRAVRATSRGGSTLTPPVASRLMGRMRGSSQTLSTREVEVLRRAYDKLGVSNRTAAVVTALERGLLELDRPGT
jgi:ABC-2 type transport system ATP-binding protein